MGLKISTMLCFSPRNETQLPVSPAAAPRPPTAVEPKPVRSHKINANGKQILLGHSSERTSLSNIVLQRASHELKKYNSDAQARYDFLHFANSLYVDDRSFGFSINDLMHKFSNREFREHHPEYMDVFPEECAAIFLQTAQDYSSHPIGTPQEIPLYREVNNTLRERHNSPGQIMANQETLKRLSPHIKVLSSALNRLIDAAPFSGTVYRGIRCDSKKIEELYELYQSNSPYIEPAFMSTTKKKDSAQVFETNTPNNIAFKITISKGADIKASTQSPSEEEVMLPAGSRFIIEGAFALPNGTYLFTLRQI